jgi:hypothetical protein
VPDAPIRDDWGPITKKCIADGRRQDSLIMILLKALEVLFRISESASISVTYDDTMI